MTLWRYQSPWRAPVRYQSSWRAAVDLAIQHFVETGEKCKVKCVTGSLWAIYVRVKL